MNKRQIEHAERSYPAIQEARALTVEQAQLFLPPTASVAKSVLDNRWRIKWCVYARSRSWTLYGELDAFARCAKYAWAEFTKTSGQECPFKFIRDALDY